MNSRRTELEWLILAKEQQLACMCDETNPTLSRQLVIEIEQLRDQLDDSDYGSNAGSQNMIEDDEELLGLTLYEAHEVADDASLALRVVQRDGKLLAGTADMQSNRVNVEVTQGIITKIRGRG